MSVFIRSKSLLVFGLFALATGCSGSRESGGSTYVGGNQRKSTEDANKNSSATSNDEKADQKVDDQTSDGQNNQGTTAPQADQDPTTEPTIVDTTPDLAKYQGYVEPTEAEITNPRNIVLYNYLQDEGISQFNGRNLKQVIPPGKAAVIPKLFADLSPITDRYMVSIKTDSGKYGSAQFDSMDVNAAGWKAAVAIDDNGTGLAISQVAGGGGGEGGSFDLKNFQ